MGEFLRQIRYSLVDQNEDYEVNVTKEYKNKKLTFNYPCPSSTECTEYDIDLNPGLFKFEVYGASGGYYQDHITLYRRGKNCFPQTIASLKSNVECSSQGSSAGAGGYTSGIILLKRKTKAYIAIGGQGLYTQSSGTCDAGGIEKSKMIKGGFNGGGYASNYFCGSTNWGSGSGGGATDVRFLEKDLYHRVIVAGGGGGSDNYSGDLLSEDDGSGGAGGGLVAQGFTISGNEDTEHVATQIDGFTFGTGESPLKDGSLNENGVKAKNGYDRGGAGGGWFGGYASHNGNGGGGGGSSFILTKTANYPRTTIIRHDTFYTEKGSRMYAFIDQNEYLFYDEIMASGVWAGNGFAAITIINTNLCSFSLVYKIKQYIPIIIILLL